MSGINQGFVSEADYWHILYLFLYDVSMESLGLVVTPLIYTYVLPLPVVSLKELYLQFKMNRSTQCYL